MENSSRAPSGISLSEALRQSSKERHAQAERAGFMPLLLAGRLPQQDYCRLLRNLHPIYVSLERGLLANRANPTIRWIYDDALNRVAAIESDLTILHGGGWQDALPTDPVASEYAGRLDRHAAGSPYLLLAHAYVRYLGDLNGGQILQRIVARMLVLTDGHGTQFYRFPFGDVRERATAFKTALDSAVLDAAERAAVLDESDWAFVQHIRLFEALHVRVLSH